MRVEINGKSTGVGAFADGFIVGYEPNYTENSKTGNHWTHVYKDVPEKSIQVEFGNSRSGRPYRCAIHADGSSVTEEEMIKVRNLKEWKEHEE